MRSIGFRLSGCLTAALAAISAVGILYPGEALAQQSDAAQARFDVASVKLHQEEPGPFRVSTAAANGRIDFINVTLKSCLRQAYGLRSYQITGGPGWISDDHYDIVAKSAGPAGRAQLMRMLQALLAERFQLKFHFETKEMPVYALVVGKSGLKIKEVKDDGKGMQIGGDTQHPFSARNISMAQFAESLSRLQELNAPVVNRTDVPGVFNIDLEFSPENTTSTDSAAPSLFSALTEQVGLKLEASRGPVRILVIDQVARPAGN
jgi:uncharacterized protein (TIGR03435 family)